MQAHSYRAILAASLLLFAVSAQSQNVNKVSSLYAAVNDPKNAGKVVRLAPGTYVLDQAQSNGGRLELQPGMTLLGQEGDPAAVVIDASALPAASYQAGGIMTGAIRMGRGTNALQWLTVTGSVGAANVETDLSSGDYPDAVVRITNVVSKGAIRGIDIRNVGLTQAQRSIEAYLADNVITANLNGEGMGLRVVNTNGASEATINVTLVQNGFIGNHAGLVADNLTSPNQNPATGPSTIGSAVKIRSSGDRFDSNGTGVLIMGGVSSVGRPTNSNLVTFDGEDDVFTNNTGTTVSGFDGGGIVVYGAWNGSLVADPTNNNAAVVTLTRPQFGSNQNADVVTYGAFSLNNPPNPTPSPGTNNHVLVVLQGTSPGAAVAVPVASQPSYPAGGNTAVVVQ